jgi:hypothetical protein
VEIELLIGWLRFGDGLQSPKIKSRCQWQDSGGGKIVCEGGRQAPFFFPAAK